jgi:hypothetical protein
VTGKLTALPGPVVRLIIPMELYRQIIGQYGGTFEDRSARQEKAA